MAASNILFNKSAAEIRDSARRLVNDVDVDPPAIPDHTLVELIIAEFIFLSHELGPDPRIPTRPLTGDQELTYSFNAGDYQTPLEGSSDVIGFDSVHHDRMYRAMTFVPRHELESWINTDLKLRGAVARGTPLYWTVKVEQRTVNEMAHSLLIYPAADDTTVVAWPRTLVDPGTVDPTQATPGRIPFSYQATFALEYKIASIMARMMTDEALARCGITRELATIYWDSYRAAAQREREERVAYFVTERVREEVR